MKTYKSMDYVCCWFFKGAQYIQHSNAELALVATNSICQGEQVGMLWPEIFKIGLSIHFAYQSFPWSNSAKFNAAVHVVVVGLSSTATQKFLNKKISGEWHKQVVTNISPYLLEGSDLAVNSRNDPLVKSCILKKGSQPTDGGALLLNSAERGDLIAREPASEKWIKRIYGSTEFINSKDRWCLWLVGATPSELKAMPAVIERLRMVEEMRLKSPKQQTRDLSETPHLFSEIRHPSAGQYILVPRHSTAIREYVPIGLLDHSIIATDAVLIMPGGTIYEFGILNSMIHNDWMRVVGGRIKSDYRYSVSLVYNNFPWPDATETQRRHIEALAEDVLMARENYPDKPLAYLYDPDTMPDDLKAAHKKLDEAVERLYRRTPFRDASERLEHLFARYEKLIEQENQQKAADAAAKKTRKPRAAKAVTAEQL